MVLPLSIQSIQHLGLVHNMANVLKAANKPGLKGRGAGTWDVCFLMSRITW